jgi:hypothetical protein
MTGTSRRALTIALVVVGVAGVCSARASVSRQQVCRTAIAAAIAKHEGVRAAFDDRLAPRNDVARRGERQGRLAKCDVPIVARNTKGTAAPGQWVAFTGTAIVTTRGLRLEGEIAALPHTEYEWRRMLRGPHR